MMKIAYLLMFSLLVSKAHAVKSLFTMDVDAELLAWQSESSRKLTPDVFVTLSQRYSWGENLKCTFEVTAKSYATFYKSNELENSEVVPRDLGCSARRGGLQSYVGFTRIDWSQNLGPQLTDLFTAYDFRRSPFTEEKDKYSSPMLKFDYFSSQTTTTFLVGAPSNKSQYLLSAQGIGSGVLIYKEEQSAADIGARFAANNSWLEWQLSAFSLADRSPQFTQLPQGRSLLESHAKYSLLSAGASLGLVGGMLRLDFDYLSGRSFTSNLLNTLKSDQIIYVLGYDSPAIANIIFSFQFAEAKLVDRSLVGVAHYNTELIALKALYMGGHKNSFEILGFENTLDASTGLRIEYIWSIRAAADLHLGGEFFFGQRDTYLESYLDQTNVYLRVVAKLAP